MFKFSKQMTRWDLGDDCKAISAKTAALQSQVAAASPAPLLQGLNPSLQHSPSHTHPEYNYSSRIFFSFFLADFQLIESPIEGCVETNKQTKKKHIKFKDNKKG